MLDLAESYGKDRFAWSDLGRVIVNHLAGITLADLIPERPVEGGGTAGKRCYGQILDMEGA